MRLRTTLLAVTAVGLLAAGCAGSAGAAKGPAGTSLSGVFRIAPGECRSGAVSGSWFRMVQPGGTVQAGPFVNNPDAPCADRTSTPLSPGKDGGLRTGAFQPQPASPFVAGGNSAATAVTQPQRFFAVLFGVSTNARDPQTRKPVSAPAIRVNGGTLTGSLSAWAVSWNGQQFNQGAPKPDGSGAGVHGSYDATTHHYSLDWTSRVVGGPFNNFIGVWHLEGTFQAA